MHKGKSAISPGEKAKQNPTSLKSAIAAYCYHNCVGEEASNSHSTKLFIKECKNEACHLWSHRPWQNVTGGNTGKIIKERLKKDAESMLAKAR
jgi:hypothetical protein